MKILVTGGAGFIGSRIVLQLLAAGYQVTVFDNLVTGHRHLVPEHATFIKGDIRDFGQLKTALAGHDAVFHLAAQAIVPESIIDPGYTFDVNLVGGQNLLEAMRANEISRLVHSSTAAVYGRPETIPIKEDDPTKPISPYGATKLAFEALLQAYHASYGLQVTMFRYFNPYGPGEAHEPETHAIPNFIHAAYSGQAIPLYWGGNQVRDFFFVDDIARAHVMALELDGLNTYNLGSGGGTKVIDMLELIFRLTGSEAPVNDLGERPGDPPTLLADITKVERELGWRPEISLEVGLKRIIKAYNANR